MISHEHQCIFIHIPKCAGTSIERALGHSQESAQRSHQDHRGVRQIQPVTLNARLFHKRNAVPLLRRVKSRFVKVTNPNNKLMLTKQQYDDYFKFTIVRNPWSRAVSWYANVIRDEIHLKNLGIDADITFPEFMRRFAGTGGLRTQVSWLKDFAGDIPMDFVARYENLAHDWEVISRKLALPDTSLPHVLKSQSHGRNYRDYYDEQTKELVAELYREEIELFGYDFDSSQSLSMMT